MLVIYLILFVYVQPPSSLLPPSLPSPHLRNLAYSPEKDTNRQLLYRAFLYGPHQDKEALEYLLQRSSSIFPSPALDPHTVGISPTYLKEIDFEGLKSDFLPEVIIIRPALMMGSGDPQEKSRGKDRTKVGEGLSVWTINRAEVGRVIVEECLPGHEEWLNKSPTIGWS